MTTTTTDRDDRQALIREYGPEDLPGTFPNVPLKRRAKALPAKRSAVLLPPKPTEPQTPDYAPHDLAPPAPPAPTVDLLATLRDAIAAALATYKPSEVAAIVRAALRSEPKARIRGGTAKAPAAPIVRTIAPGSRIDPDAILTMKVENPCTGVKNHARWEAGYPNKGQSATVKDILAIAGGPTIGDLRYGYERAWIDIEPPPAPAKK
jgi:hypothetical protein